MITLGVKVRDKVTGLEGIAENRATFIYGCARYSVQPQVNDKGEVPKNYILDEPQLEVIDAAPVMEALPEPEPLFKMGEKVYDPITGLKGTVTGRSVYLNGCARIYVELRHKPMDLNPKDGYWVDEPQLEPQKTFTGKTKVAHEPAVTDPSLGGPARSNSKY